MSNPNTSLVIKPLDAQKLFETQVDNIFRPLKHATSIFVPVQFGGVLNQLSLYLEKDCLTFMEVLPATL